MLPIKGKLQSFSPFFLLLYSSNDLKIESLDDLFDDEPTVEEAPTLPQEETVLPQAEPTLPQDVEDSKEDEVFSIDVQKELEAKFDELFGPLDED